MRFCDIFGLICHSFPRKCCLTPHKNCRKILKLCGGGGEGGGGAHMFYGEGTEGTEILVP